MRSFTLHSFQYLKTFPAQRETDLKMVLPMSLGEWLLIQGNLSPLRDYGMTSLWDDLWDDLWTRFMVSLLRGRDSGFSWWAEAKDLLGILMPQGAPHLHEN